MDHGVEYRRKRVTPEAAAATVPSGSSLVVSPGPAAPPALLAALAQRARGGELSGLRVYFMLAFKALAETLLAPDLAAPVEPYSLFMSDVERALALIGLAHPQFRDDLLCEAKKMRLV